MEEAEAARTDQRSAREELRCVLAVIRHGGAPCTPNCTQVVLWGAGKLWTRLFFSGLEGCARRAHGIATLRAEALVLRVRLVRV